MMIEFGWMQISAGLVLMVIILVAVWRRKKNMSYLFFSIVFWIYLLGVFSVVIFPFPIRLANPNFTLNINLVPFYFGSCFDELPALCFRIIFANILLTIPFGFWINFLARIKPKHIFWLAVGVGMTFETAQLVISLITRNSFRAVDINDLILNALGILIGYGLFKVFSVVYAYVIGRFGIQPRHIFAYILGMVSNSD